jgi:hypothetical protein
MGNTDPGFQSGKNWEDYKKGYQKAQTINSKIIMAGINPN